MESSGDNLQGSAMDGGGDNPQGSGMEGSGDRLQGSGMEGGGDSLTAGVARSGMSTVIRTPLSLPRPEQSPGTDTLVGDEGGGKGGRGDEDGKEGEEQSWSGK